MVLLDFWGLEGSPKCLFDAKTDAGTEPLKKSQKITDLLIVIENGAQIGWVIRDIALHFGAFFVLCSKQAPGVPRSAQSSQKGAKHWAQDYKKWAKIDTELHQKR